MKVKFAVLSALFLVVVLSGIGHTDPTPTPVYTADYELYAGQSIFVGWVHVGNDGNYLYVKYDITVAGWEITETHVHVGIDLWQDFPLTSKGNPKIGQFDYSTTHDPAVTEFNYNIPMTWAIGDHVLIGAHAVVTDAGMVNYSNKVYGTTISGTKGLWELDIPANTYTNLLDTTGGAFVGNTTGYCNGMAYDAVNNVIYFTTPYSASVAPSPLWKFEIDTKTLTKIGVLPKIVVGASFYNNRYYFITDYTDDLMMIDLGAPIAIGLDGYIVTTTVFADFSSRGNVYTFGDFAISKDGMLYGSTRVSPQIFFSLDVNSMTGDYYEYLGSNALDLQLAFGADGKLYGQNHGSRNWYVVDVLTGLATPIAFKNLAYADLASGMYFDARNETAWGNGPSFPGNSWAEYFGYTITGLVIPDPAGGSWGEETAWCGNYAGDGAAWWYYYDTQGPAVQKIYAGQKLVDGASIEYDPVAEELIITLGPNMRLQDVSENIKIDNVRRLDDKRPAGGQFPIKGYYTPNTENLVFTIDVSGYDLRYFYVHLDCMVYTP